MPQNLTIQNLTHESVSFCWEAPDADEGRPVTWYIFETVECADEMTIRKKTLSHDQREVKVDSLYHRHTLYDYRVAAKNKHGIGLFLNCK